MTDTEQSNGDSNQSIINESRQSSNYSRVNPMRIFQWYRKLQIIEKFNFWIFLFTGVLSLVGVFQVVAYIETERAFMVAEEVRLFAGEPISDDGGLSAAVFVKNAGKHLAIITDFSVAVEVLIVQKSCRNILNTWPELT
ncbi:MAG: hypothetical protein HP490_06875 [Nitrospira sp.]|nr:hypothetical protein [Nitrospira sp.]